MKAILLAAGVGSRFSNVLDYPKCTCEVGNMPLIEHTVKMLTEHSIKVSMVVGFKKEKIYEVLHDYEVTYYENPFYRETNSLGSLWFAKDEFNVQDDIIIANADVFWEEGTLDIIQADSRSAVLLSDKSRIDIGDFHFSVVDEKIVRYGKNMPIEERSCEYVGVGKIRSFFVTTFLQHMKELVSDGRYDLWWENVLYEYCAEYPVYVHDVDGLFWGEIDVTADYERIKRYMDEKRSMKTQKLFTLGPVEMYPYTLRKASEQIPYFRTPEFSKIVLETETLLKNIANAKSDDKVVFLTSSGTGAMEATVMNCLSQDDYVLVIDGGTFGHRFVELCELHNIKHEILKVPYGKAFSAEWLEKYEMRGFTTLLVNIDETSTAQLYPIKILSDFCQRNRMYLIVDAISSFLVDPFDFSTSKIDAAIFSSQKAFALAPGLSMVILSKRLYEERVEHINSHMMYFDFKGHIKDGLRGQTPFTPAVATILQLHQRLLKIQEEGVLQVIAHASHIAQDFRERMRLLPVSIPQYPLSNACTPLVFDNGKAYQVYETLKRDYSLIITPNGGDLAQNVVRVGHMGNHTVEDNILLVEKIQEVLSRL